MLTKTACFQEVFFCWVGGSVLLCLESSLQTRPKLHLKALMSGERYRSLRWNRPEAPTFGQAPRQGAKGSLVFSNFDQCPLVSNIFPRSKGARVQGFIATAAAIERQQPRAGSPDRDFKRGSPQNKRPRRPTFSKVQMSKPRWISKWLVWAAF